MSIRFGALIAVLFLSACGSSYQSAPRNLDNACSIAAQRPNYVPAMQRSERKWGVPVAVMMATIYQESKFIANAKTPRTRFFGIPTGRVSSAKGYSQALDGTWDDYRRATGSRLASRTNINDATDFMGWYMSKSRDILGIPLNDARNQYLAYHEGRGGYSRGTYRSKAWLLDVSRAVATRANMYDRQLRSCNLV